MSENNIDDPEQEPTDEQLRSDEARRLRLQRNEARDTAANAIQAAADANARAEAAERKAIDAEHLRGHFADPVDYWSRTDLKDLRAEDGSIDGSLVDGQRDQILADHPQYRATPATGAAPAGVVGASGLIGFGPRSVLDTENTQPVESRGWSAFLEDAAKGEV